MGCGCGDQHLTQKKSTKIKALSIATRIGCWIQ